MGDVINQLAAMDVSENALIQVDMQNVLQHFQDTYKKLDNFKNVRSAHEQRGFFSRLWNSNEVKDAQLDAVEVQANFSKTIGQLMMISILQSKMLAGQQTLLNAQQTGLKVQADGIEENTKKLQEQQQVLKEQAEKQKKLVNDYFALEGLTRNGAERLVQIAREVKETKEDLLGQFQKEVLDLHAMIQQFSEQIEEQLQQTEARFGQIIEAVRSEAERNQNNLGVTLREEGVTLSRELSQALGKLSETVARGEATLSDLKIQTDGLFGQMHTYRIEMTALSAKFEMRSTELGACREQVRVHREAQVQFERTTLVRFRKIVWCLGLGIATSLGMLAWVVYHLKGN